MDVRQVNGKKIQIALAVATFIVGLAAGSVGATWSVEDRVDSKIDRAISPIQKDVREIRDLLYRHFAPQAGGR